jgi:hypothetical protein
MRRRVILRIEHVFDVGARMGIGNLRTKDQLTGIEGAVRDEIVDALHLLVALAPVHEDAHAKVSAE